MHNNVWGIKSSPFISKAKCKTLERNYMKVRIELMEETEAYVSIRQ
jgi:hypothetical protein